MNENVSLLFQVQQFFFFPQSKGSFSSEMNETVKVDMSGFASGIYFVKLQAGDATSVQKIMKK